MSQQHTTARYNTRTILAILNKKNILPIVLLLFVFNIAQAQFVLPSDTIFYSDTLSLNVQSPNSAYTYQWEMGDGNNYNGTAISHTYTSNCATQSFDIKLKSYNGTTLLTSSTQTLVAVSYVPKPSVSDIDIFTPFSNCDSSPSNSNPDFSITLNNTTADTNLIAYYIINWGDNSAVQNINNSSFPISHQYTQLGLFTFTITAYDYNNCSRTTSYTIANQSNPAVGLSTLGNTQGCAPQTFSFILSQFQNNSPGTYYVWDFGDGTPSVIWDYNQPYISNSISHIYDTTSCTQGSFSFTVSVTAFNSCDQTTATVGNIRIYSAPQAKFVSSMDTACVGSPVNFINQTISGFGYSCSSSASYIWNFGDSNSLQNTAITTSSAHTYNQTGIYAITLQASNGICGSSQDTQWVVVNKMPKAIGQISKPEGCVPTTVQLSNASTGGNLTYNWTVSPNQGWSFAQNTNAKSQNPEFSFTIAGNYSIKLTASNNCGSNDTTFYFKAQDTPLLLLASPADACGQLLVNPTASIQIKGSQIQQYTWTFSHPTQTQSTLAQPQSILFQNVGIQEISLHIENACGTANDTVSFEIFAIPTIQATSSVSEICFGDTLQINTTGANQYQWNNSQSLSAPSAAQTLAFPSQTTNYIVQGTDLNNCSSSDTIEIHVNALPNVQLLSSTTVMCSGDSISIQSQGATNYQWLALQNHSVINNSSILYYPQQSGVVLVTGTDNKGCQNMDTLQIQVQQAPQLSFVQNNPQICKGDQIQLQINGGHTYQWSPSTGLSSSTLANPIANPVTTTQYSIQSLSPAGCASDTQITVQVLPVPQISASSSASQICLGEAIQLNASGATVYNWTNTQNTTLNGNAQFSHQPTNAFTYIVKGYNAYGCFDTDSVTVAVHALPQVSISASSAQICAGDSSILQANGASSYVWKNSGLAIGNGSQLAIQGLQTQSYMVIGTDINNCKDSTTQSIQVHALPVLSSNKINPSICLGDSVSIYLSGANNYQWSPAVNAMSNGSNAQLSPVQNTLYHIIGTNGFGCNDSLEINVDVKALPLVQAATNKQHLCLGQSAQLSANGAQSYQWSPASNLNSSVSSFVSATPVSSTQYTVVGTDANGCSSSDTISLSVSNLLNITVTTNKASICHGDTVKLNANGADSYLWANANGLLSLNGNQVYATPQVPTQFIVTGTDTNGCISTNSVQVDVHALPAVNATASLHDVCPGDTTVLTSNGAITYEWTNLNSGINHIGHQWTFIPTQNTSFKVEGTNIHNCKATSYVDIISAPVPNLNINAAKDSICLGESISIIASGATNYLWKYNNVSTGGQSLNNAPNQNTWYTLEGSNNFGCTDIDSVHVTVLNLPNIQLSTNNLDLCFGDSANIQIQGATQYSFNPSSGISLSNNMLNVNPSTTTNYIITGSNPFGCENTKVLNVASRSLPSSIFHVDSILCLNSSHTFQNSSTGANTFDWSFGDGSLSSNQIPTHAYQSSGYYVVKLKATTPYGCSDSSSQITQVIQTPTASFMSSTNQGCAPLNIQVTNSSIGMNTNFLWNFGNGTSSSNKNPSNPVFNSSLSQDTSYIIQLTSTNQCGTATEKDTITVHPSPHSNFGFSLNTNCSPSIASFANASTGLSTSYLWDLGDNTSSGQTIPSAHTYYANQNVTTYDVKLIAYNNCGTDTITKTVSVQPNVVNAFFTPSSTVACAPAQIQFGNFSNATNQVNWDFGDNNFSSSISPNHTYTQPGTYQVEMIVSDDCGIDTAYNTIVVQAPPALTYQLSSDTICQGQTIQLLNLNNNLSNIEWIFNDSTSSTLNLSTHQYNDAGIHYVKLIGKSLNLVCSDTAMIPVIVHPKAQSTISSNYQEGCSPLTTQFTVSSQNASYYIWDFDDGSQGLQQNPNHTFNKAGNYYCSLISNNFYNCPDTTVTLIKTYPKPQSSFTLPSAPMCKTPLLLSMTNTSSGAAAYSWDFGNNTTSIQKNPSTTYNTDGNYSISLLAVSSFGCKDTSYQTIKILPNPKANFYTDKKQACALNALEFHNTSTNANSYLWHFGDGKSSQVTSPLHAYDGKGEFAVMLIAFNDMQCSDTMIIANKLQIHPVPKVDFTWHPIYQSNDNKGLIQFENKSIDATLFSWDFDNGEGSSECHPIHQFTSHGVYNIRLYADNVFGCARDTVQSVRVQLIKALYVPNAIAPHHPNTEISHFQPKGIGIESYEITIYDQWGNTVWYSNSLIDGQPSEYWDGKNNGTIVPPGMYVWNANAVFEDGSVWQGNELEATKTSKTKGIVRVIR